MSDKEWFLYVVDHHEGPYHADELKDLVKKGKVQPTTFVWKQGLQDWTKMSDVGDLNPGQWGTDSHGQPAMLIEGGGPSLMGIRDSAMVFCLESQKTYSGPHSLKAIMRRLNAGELKITDRIWKEGWTSLVPLSDFPEVTRNFKPLSSGKQGSFWSRLVRKNNFLLRSPCLREPEFAHPEVGDLDLYYL